MNIFCADPGMCQCLNNQLEGIQYENHPENPLDHKTLCSTLGLCYVKCNGSCKDQKNATFGYEQN